MTRYLPEWAFQRLMWIADILIVAFLIGLFGGVWIAYQAGDFRTVQQISQYIAAVATIGLLRVTHSYMRKTGELVEETRLARYSDSISKLIVYGIDVVRENLESEFEQFINFPNVDDYEAFPELTDGAFEYPEDQTVQDISDEWGKGDLSLDDHKKLRSDYIYHRAELIDKLEDLSPADFGHDFERDLEEELERIHGKPNFTPPQNTWETLVELSISFDLSNRTVKGWVRDNEKELRETVSGLREVEPVRSDFEELSNVAQNLKLENRRLYGDYTDARRDLKNEYHLAEPDIIETKRKAILDT